MSEVPLDPIRAETERALRRSEERYHLLFENLTLGFALHEVILSEGRVVDYRFLEVNSAFERLMGLKMEQILGHTVREVMPSVEDYWIETYGRVAMEGIPIHYESYTKESGKWYEIWAYRSAPLQFAVLIADITPRKAAEDVMHDLTRELEVRVEERTTALKEANRELESFTYYISHDLRAPLRTLDSFSQLLLTDYSEQLPEQGHHYIQQMRKGAQRMGTLIDDLLRFAHLGRMELVMERVDMANLVHEVLDELHSSHARPMELRIETLLPCHGDRGLLKQVWSHLLSNAMKFSKEPHSIQIEIESYDMDGERVYHVRDNGVGFDMHYVNKLFQVFQKLHRREDFDGTGIGLALVRHIVQRHGGRIWAESTPGAGVCFTFTIPDRDLTA